MKGGENEWRLKETGVTILRDEHEANARTKKDEQGAGVLTQKDERETSEKS